MKNTKTKFFRIATEGATVDGRDITREWIEEMAESYDPKTYGARIWLEHIRGTMPDSPFKAYGDVLEVEAREVEDGKLALFARLDATPDLVAMNRDAQKVFTSIEIQENFAKTGGAYLVGLGITDSPASLGTDRLMFSSRQGKREVKEGYCFSEPIEADIPFENETPSRFASTLDKLNKLRKGNTAKTDKAFGDVAQVLESVAESMGDVKEQLDQFASLRESVARLESDLKQDRDNFNALKDSLDSTPAGKVRPTVSGGANHYALTDC